MFFFHSHLEPKEQPAVDFVIGSLATRVAMSRSLKNSSSPREQVVGQMSVGGSVYLGRNRLYRCRRIFWTYRLGSLHIGGGMESLGETRAISQSV